MKTSIYFFLLLFFCVNLAFTQNEVSKVTVIKPTYFDISPPLRDMAVLPTSKVDNSWKDGVVKNYFNDQKNTKTLEELGISDPNLQNTFGMTPLDTTIVNVAGLGGGSFSPPDTYGAVGPNHYFQVVNCSYAIYNKSGVKIFGAYSTSSVWTGMPNNHNDGDAVVLYDSQADRWLFSQFSLGPSGSGPFYQMIAISQTPDPTGSWYRWEFNFSSMPDYPKFGIWPDGYYYSAHRYSAAGSYQGLYAAVYDRTLMLTGDAGATMQLFSLAGSSQGFGYQPSTCDGPFPPAGQPNDYVYFHGNHELGMYEFHTDWTTPANSTFTLLDPLTVNTFSPSSDIPQKGTNQLLMSLSDRLMYRTQFRQFSDHQSIVLNHTVNAGSNIAGVRWYELRNVGSGWTVYQQGTYSPDSNYRWMGSIAMDSLGDIALGYSISSSTMYPSIRYTGRMSCDVLGLMTLAEGGIINGGTYQLQYGGRNRWGDYSSMTADPAQPQTFWYTQEYHQSSSSMFAWLTRIASFSFANQICVTASATPSTLCIGGTTQLDANASGGSGTFTYSWTSDPAGFTSSIQNPDVTPTITTKYIAHADDGTKIKTDTVQVTVNQLAIAYAGKDSIYCITPNLRIIMYGQASNYSHIQWTTSGDGTFNVDTLAVCLYTPGPADKAGYVTVTLTLTAFALAPCTKDSVDPVHLTLSPCNAIHENSNEAFTLSLSPNPSQGIFTIKITGLQKQESNFTVSDIHGRTLLRETLVGTKTVSRQVDISNYPKGIYMVKVQTADQVRTEKMVIQ